MPPTPNHSLRLSQEGLKGIACISMLLDHTGAILILPLYYALARGGHPTQTVRDLYDLLRTLGRLAFPIYCFLLVEGVIHTRNPRRYGLRLLISAILSELPFDLALHSAPSWQNQSVMITLLLGFLALTLMNKCPPLPVKLLVLLPFLWAADWMNTDYGAKGVALIALFALTRDIPRKHLIQTLGMWCIFSPNHLMALNWLEGFSLTTQELAVFAMIPIALYSGEKKTGSKKLQWAFYLFYPVHLTVLWGLKCLFFG